MARLRSPADRALLDAIRRLPETSPSFSASELFDAAERHGLAGVLLDAWRAAGRPLPPERERALVTRDVARSCDHAAHLDMLHRLDVVLGEAELRAVALKGALLGERLYPRPAARPTSDVDLLVDEAALDRAIDALRRVGYSPSTAASESHFRRRGHHLHLEHRAAPVLELHFAAYQGFGRTLRSEALLDRSVPVARFDHLRVLGEADELLYLAVHAAGHRFLRLGWLYDLLLFLQRADPRSVPEALRRADETGMARPLALAFEQLEGVLGWTRPAGLETRSVLGLRKNLLAAITEEPRSPWLRSATRFAYTLALCNDGWAALRYLQGTAAYRLERLALRAS